MDDDIHRYSIRKVVSSTSFKIALSFTVAILLFETLLLPLSYEKGVLARHFASGSYFRLIATLTLSAAALASNAAFFWMAFNSRIWIRVVCFAVFSFVCMVEYDVYSAFQRFSWFNDLLEATFVGDRFVVQAAAEYFYPSVLIPVSAFGILLFVTRKGTGASLRRWTVLITAMLSLFAVTSYWTRNTYYVTAFSAGLRTAISYPVIYLAGTSDGRAYRLYYAAKRDAPTFHSAERPTNNIVVIIDESVRADHMSLNGYVRPTTAILTKLAAAGSLKNWGIAASGTTCSISSNALLLTGVTELPDKELAVLTRPTIFQYARAMNYATHYFDGNITGLWNGKTSDIPDYGEWIQHDEFLLAAGTRYDIDAEIARRVKSIVSTSTGNFIYINKFGIHLPYTESYPNKLYSGSADTKMNKYDPTSTGGELIDEYDSALTYNSSTFFENLFTEGPSPNTVYVYTSDHGQTLGENGATVSHCSTSKPEAMVPLFIVRNADTIETVDTKYPASHSNIFATLLDLMRFPQSERKFGYAPSLLSVGALVPKPRTYYAGDLPGRNDGRIYQFDQ